MAKHWCCYSPKTFIINEVFVTTIMSLLTGYPSLEIFKKVINVLKKMLTSSSHAKLLGSMRLDQALLPKAMPEQDRNFLLQLVEYLFSQKEKYQLSVVGMYTVDDESAEDQEKALFANKFTQLLLALCSNYEVLFLTPENWQAAQKLYELLFIAAKAKNLVLVS